MFRVILPFFFLFLSGIIHAQENDFDAVGLEHNRIVAAIIPHLTSEIKDGDVITTLADYGSIPLQSLPDVIRQNPSLDDPFKLVDDLRDAQLVDDATYNLVLNFLNSIRESTIQQTLDAVEQARTDHGDNQQFLDFLSGVKHSTSFWGLGEYQEHASDEFRAALESGGGVTTGDDSGNGTILALSRRFWRCMACDAAGCLLGPQAGAVATTCAAINNYW